MSKKDNILHKKEKLAPKYNIEKPAQPVPYLHRDLAPINRRFCIYHPVTQVFDCLKCEAPCSILGNLMGPDLERVVSKDMRDKIWEYFWGEDSPLIELAETTGITLSVELVRTEPMWAPKKIAYLKERDSKTGELRNMNFQEFYEHMRLFYQGRLVWQAMGAIHQAGLLISSLPQEIRLMSAYYEFHRDAMEGKIDPNKKILIEDNKDKLKLLSKEKEMEFADADSAMRYFIGLAVEVARKEKDLKGDELINEVTSFVRDKVDSTEVSNPDQAPS